MPAFNSSTWRSQKLTVAAILPAGAPAPGHSRTQPEARRARNATTTGVVPAAHVVAHRYGMWHDDFMDATLVLGRQGRLVIPADIRTALGLAPGDRLHLHVTGRRLVLERQQDAVAELRALGAGLLNDRSLVEELLAERRLAAEAE
jgi:antitoxin PrlF